MKRRLGKDAGPFVVQSAADVEHVGPQVTPVELDQLRSVLRSIPIAPNEGASPAPQEPTSSPPNLHNGFHRRLAFFHNLRHNSYERRNVPNRPQSS